jgi:hypothetical protein
VHRLSSNCHNSLAWLMMLTELVQQQLDHLLLQKWQSTKTVSSRTVVAD